MRTSIRLEALECRCFLTLIGPNFAFGDGGVVTLANDDGGSIYTSLRTIVMVAGEKLLLIADDFELALHRLNADGSADTTFGENGTVSYENMTYDVLNVTVLPDQRVILEMFNFNADDGRLQLWRFNADGTQDDNFGAVEPAVHRVVGKTALVVDANGKILLGGSVGDDFAIERFNPDGTLDTTFADGGMLLRSDVKGVQAMALDAQGRILALGVSTDFSARLYRFLPGGDLDPSFDGDGIIILDDLAGAEDISPVAVYAAPDGTVLLQRDSPSEFRGGFILHRFNADGSIDEAFGDPEAGPDYGLPGLHEADVGIQSLFIAPNGGITVSLQALDGSVYAYRYNPDGSLDATFNDSGTVALAFPFAEVAGPALVIDADTILQESHSEFAAPKLIEVTSATPGQSLHNGVLTIIGSDDTDAISIARTGDTLTVKLNGDSTDYAADEVERIVIFSGDGQDSVTGSDGDDHIIVTAKGTMTIDARGGDDRVILNGGGTVLGGSGDDFVRAASTWESFASLYGGDGRDTLFAGDGDDTLVGGAQGDRLYGAGGHDFLLGCGGNDRLFGGYSNDTLQGARGDDYLDGYDGMDRLIAGPGTNSLHGGNDDDIFLAGNSQADELFGGEGNNLAAELDSDLDVLTDVATT